MCQSLIDFFQTSNELAWSTPHLNGELLNATIDSRLPGSFCQSRELAVESCNFPCLQTSSSETMFQWKQFQDSLRSLQSIHSTVVALRSMRVTGSCLFYTCTSLHRLNVRSAREILLIKVQAEVFVLICGWVFELQRSNHFKWFHLAHHQLSSICTIWWSIN